MVSRLALLVVLGACAPELVDDTYLVTEPRVLAVRAQPAEVAPGHLVSLEALWADPARPVDAPIAWSFCTARKPVTEAGAVDPTCLESTSPALATVGQGVVVTGTLPDSGCRLFGPDRPDPEPGKPSGRPVDPDGTGGFYQPVTLFEPAQTTLAQVRLHCGFPAVTPGQAAELARRVHPNGNPAITGVVLRTATGDVPLVARETDASAQRTVPPGADLELAVTWPACPTSDVCGDAVCGATEDATGCAADCATPQTCAGAEAYAWFDPEARTIATRREAMRVTWFATAGTFELGRTGRDEAAADESTTTNRFTAPGAGDVTIWIVLRDDRGGATWASYRFVVE